MSGPLAFMSVGLALGGMAALSWWAFLRVTSGPRGLQMEGLGGHVLFIQVPTLCLAGAGGGGLVWLVGWLIGVL